MLTSVAWLGEQPALWPIRCPGAFADSASLRQVVNAVHAIPYGRPLSRTTQGVLGEWKGTCSTKHALLAQLLGEQWPDTCPRLVHGVYHITRAAALARYGGDAAAAVPDDGLTGGVSQSGGSLVGAFAASVVIRDQVAIVKPLLVSSATGADAKSARLEALLGHGRHALQPMSAGC